MDNFIFEPHFHVRTPDEIASKVEQMYKFSKHYAATRKDIQHLEFVIHGGSGSVP